MAVCGQLDAIGEPSSKIVHEMVGASGIPLPDEPAGDEFRIGIQRNPGQNVTPSFGLFLVHRILLLSSNEGPNLIALDALRGEVPKSLVLILRACRAEVALEFHDRGAMYAGHAGDRAEGISLHQRGNHSLPFLCAQLVHKRNLLERSRIRKENLQVIEEF